MFHMGPAALANCTMRASHSEAPLVPQVPPLAAPTLPPTKERAKSTEAVGPGEQLRPGPRTSRVRLCPHAAGARPQRCGILSLLLLSHVSVFISHRTFHRRLAALGVSSLFNLMKIEKFKTICPCPSQQPEHHGPQRRLKGTRVQGVGGAWHPVPREQSRTMLVCHLTAGSARETHSGEALGENKHTLKFSLENSILRAGVNNDPHHLPAAG